MWTRLGERGFARLEQAGRATNCTVGPPLWSVEPLQYTSSPPCYDSLPALSRYSYALTLKVYNQDTDGKEKSNISC